ncbi:MAG: hypothetical protein Q4C41_03355 [Eggerthellaceae bacterium]|nr:hypothetical protein [Eggerthellaceae bacterium]
MENTRGALPAGGRALRTALAAALAACALTLATALPQSAWAEGESGDTTTTAAEALQNALNEGGTVTLTQNVEGDFTIGENVEVTLDLAGYKITNVSGHTIINNGELTIVDSSGTKTGTVDNVTHASGALVNKGTCIVESGNFTRSQEAGSSPSDSGSNSWYVIDNNGGTLTFNGGKVYSTGKFSSLIRNLNATLAINGGEFTNGFIALKNDENGKLYMNGGTVTSDNQAIQNWSEASVKNAVLNGSAVCWSYGDAPSTLTIGDGTTVNGDVRAINYDNAMALPSVRITGEGVKVTGEISKGEYDATEKKTKVVDPSASSSKIEISNGSFDKAPADDFIAPDSVLTKNADGTYGVHVHELVKHDAVAPTCVAAGNKVYYECSVCGLLFEDEVGETETTAEAVAIAATGKHSFGEAWKPGATSHWHECSVCGAKADEADHEFVEVIDKEATATEPGSKHQECKACGYEKGSEVIPATGAANDNAGTSDNGTGDNANATATADKPAKPAALAKTGDAIPATALAAAGVAAVAAIACGFAAFRKGRARR